MPRRCNFAWSVHGIVTETANQKIVSNVAFSLSIFVSWSARNVQLVQMTKCIENTAKWQPVCLIPWRWFGSKDPNDDPAIWTLKPTTPSLLSIWWDQRILQTQMLYTSKTRLNSRLQMQLSLPSQPHSSLDIREHRKSQLWSHGANLARIGWETQSSAMTFAPF